MRIWAEHLAAICCYKNAHIHIILPFRQLTECPLVMIAGHLSMFQTRIIILERMTQRLSIAEKAVASDQADQETDTREQQARTRLANCTYRTYTRTEMPNYQLL